MDAQLRAVGDRIKESLPTGMTQAALAHSVDMTPDALSRALSGKRGFSLPEITRIAKKLGVDLTWLLTSEPGVHTVTVAARHDWDPARRVRSNPNHTADSPILDSTLDLYRRSFPSGTPASASIPHDPSVIRQQLGTEFVRDFAERIEDEFGVDVVRTPGLRTAYSLRIGDRGIIILSTDSNWFRSNWSLAHELGHLALGHHENSAGDTRTKENDADAFAADLLLPAADMRALPWATMNGDDLGHFLWGSGVSTRSLANRLRYLRLPQSPEVAAALEESTPTVLKKTADRLEPFMDNRRALAHRRQQSSAPRYPLALVEALTEGVEAGRIDPGLLAGVLGVEIDDVLTDHSVPEPESEAAAADRLLAASPLSLTSPALASWLQNQ